MEIKEIKSFLKNIHAKKQLIQGMQKEYNDYLVMADKLSDCCPSTSEKYTKMSDQIYSNIQREVDLYKRIIQAINDLPEKQKNILQLHYFEKMCLTHISKMMNIEYSRLNTIENKAFEILKVSLCDVI